MAAHLLLEFSSYQNQIQYAIKRFNAAAKECGNFLIFTTEKEPVKSGNPL